MAVTDKTFVMDKDFDAQDYFSAYYGVMQGGDEPKQRIVLRAFGNERYAMRDLPLHLSQKELAVGDDYMDFEVKLHLKLPPPICLKPKILRRLKRICRLLRKAAMLHVPPEPHWRKNLDILL
jgi:hypothetical protein